MHSFLHGEYTFLLSKGDATLEGYWAAALVNGFEIREGNNYNLSLRGGKKENVVIWQIHYSSEQDELAVYWTGGYAKFKPSGVTASSFVNVDYVFSQA